MKNPLRLTLVTLLLALCGSPAVAQSGLTSEGTDFWLAFMPNYLSPADNIRLFIASGIHATVHVDAYGGSVTPQQTLKQTLAPNKPWTLSFPSASLVEERMQETAEYKAVHVYSDNPIAVYGFSNVYTTSDSYLALPSSALGTDYFVSCFYDDNYNELGLSDPLAGEFVVIASADSTVVTIGPVQASTRSDAAGSLSHKIGESWNVTMRKGQTYLVQSTGVMPGDQDLTGSRVTSTKPVGVICGHQRCRIPVDGHGNSKDMIMEMMLPTNRWGTEYFELPQGGRIACGDYVRIIAGEDNCEVMENGQQITQLDRAGDFVDRELVLDPVHYTSNGKKFMVVSHSYSQNYNGDPIQSDPFSILMTPRNLFEKRMLFRVPNNVAAGTEYDNFATFVCSKDSIAHIQINGKSITAYQLAGKGDFNLAKPAMSAYRVKLPDAAQTYLATCGAPFGCYLYGFSYAEAFGHPAGMALNVSSNDTIVPVQSKREYVHQYFNLCFADEGSKIAAMHLILDSNDARWTKPSNNFVLQYSHDPFSGPDSEGYTQVCVQLKVLDSLQDGYAALWVTDRAGNDTVYEYSYKGVNAAPKGMLTATPPTYAFGTIDTGQSKAFTFTLSNIGNAPDTISSLTVKEALSSYSLIATPSAPTVVQPNGTVSLSVTFAPHVAGYLTGSIQLGEADGTTGNIVSFSGIGQLPLPPPPPNSVTTESLRGVQLRVVPNPSHGEALCVVTLDHPEPLRLVAIDALGRQVFSQDLGLLGAGEHPIDGPFASLPNGTYFLRLLSASGTLSTKVTIAR
jgi:hypothetical protein